MNLIILAAGRGRRLYPLTRYQPKTLLDIGGGVTLLGSQLDAAVESAAIDRVTIVAGHLCEQVEAVAASYASSLAIEVVFNPYFDLSGALFSLWTAHYLMPDTDFMVSNGDNYYRHAFFDRLDGAIETGIAATVSRRDPCGEDDMKVRFDGAGRFERIGKQIEVEPTTMVSVGCLTVKGEAARRAFHTALIDLVRRPDNRDAYWQAILNRLVDRGVPVLTTDIPGSWWAEVDLHPDAESLRKTLIDSIAD